MLVISAKPDVSDTALSNLRHIKIYEYLEKHNYNFNTSELIDITLDEKVINPNLFNFFKDCWESYKTKDPTYVNEEIGIIPCKITNLNPNIACIINTMVTWKQVGFWCTDCITPIKKDTYNRIMKSVLNSISVINHLDNYNVIYCLNNDPGHHASNNNYGGYCYINNAAVCAFEIKNKYKDVKISILDLDHHAGDGTEEIFKHEEDYQTISIHANPIYEYPFYSGYPNRKNINLVFEPNSTIDIYMNLVERAMDMIKNFNSDYLIIAFGCDSYINDPEASTSCKGCLDINDYYEIGKYIKTKYNKNIIVTQEGGYDLNSVDKIVYNFLQGLNE